MSEGFAFQNSLNFNPRISIIFSLVSLFGHYSVTSHFCSSLLFISISFSSYFHFKNLSPFLYYCIVDARDLKLETGPYSTKSAYSNFNMTICKHIEAATPLTVEFVGYSSNHDEKHSRSSANIAPYRTKSSRPVRYEKILNYVKW